jgi:hypothetical protein
MSNKQQTAVDWLVEQLPLIQQEGLRDIIEQAKEIEKQQIIEAFKHGEMPPLFLNLNAEQYYNETYNQ